MIDQPFGSVADAPASLVLTGVRVIDPASRTDAIRDVAILDGVIADPALAGDAVEQVDGRGLVVAPGFVDLHAHLRDPGGDEAETIATGTRAAARGGFTTICTMPNTEPALDDGSLLEQLAQRAADAACRVRFVAAATPGRSGRSPSELGALAAAGAVAFSDDGATVADGALDAVLARAAELGLPLIEHAEDADLARESVMRRGAVATRLGLPGWPGEAEARIVERDVAAAERCAATVHFTHLSTADAVAAVHAAKERGVRVTADVTPHHLAMTDEWVAGSRAFAWDDSSGSDAAIPDPRRAYDGACRVNPPLPSRADARALLDALRDGTVDAIATDHAPHPSHRKLVPFREAAPGLIGLETALSLGLAAVAAGALDLQTLLGAMSTRPAAIIGERRTLEMGDVANLVAFDPEARWRVDRSTLASRSTNTPLLGMELAGVVRLTVAHGRVTYRSQRSV